MTTVPVGRRSLFAERRRAVLGIAGVGVALLLVLALDAIFAGATQKLTRYIDTSPAQVFVSRDVRTMHMSSSSLPLSAVAAIRRLPGVTWAEPILYLSSSINAGAARQFAYVIGYENRGGPEEIPTGSRPGRDEIVMDDRAAADMRVGLGDTVFTLGRTWRISGLGSGLTSFSNTVAFVRLSDFTAAAQMSGSANYVLVGTTADPALTAQRIESATGLTAQTQATFSGQESQIVKDMSGDLMKIMTTAALLIGLVVVALTLYAATLSRLREIGVMKALGARSGRLAGIVLGQAAWTIGPALVVAIGLAYALAGSIERFSPNVSMVIEPASILRTFAGAVLLGAVGAVAPLLRVARVDPASVFRRPL